MPLTEHTAVFGMQPKLSTRATRRRTGPAGRAPVLEQVNKQPLSESSAVPKLAPAGAGRVLSPSGGGAIFHPMDCAQEVTIRRGSRMTKSRWLYFTSKWGRKHLPRGVHLLAGGEQE